MTKIIQKLTLPNRGWFAFTPKKQLNEFLSDPDNNWFVLAEEVSGSPGNASVLSVKEAKSALKNGKTIYKMTKSVFIVNLHFEEMTLCDENTLTVNVKTGVKISDPIRFFRLHSIRMSENTKLTEDNLCDLWEAPFYNVLQVEAHKLDLASWKTGLTGATITSALQRYYYAPMAAKYVDGTTFDVIKSVEGNSPSEEKRLQEELNKQQKELEEEQRQRISAQNKAEHEAKLEAMREQIRLKELEIQAKQEERIAQEAEYQRRIEEAKLKAAQDRQRKQDELRIAMAHSNKWSELSGKEKAIAIEFSILMKNQAEVNNVEMKNTAISATSILYQGVWGEWNALRKGESLEFSLVPSCFGFITILNLGTSGKMTVLAPNSLTGSNTQFAKVEQGVKYSFPQSFMPDLDPDSFEENSSSGLEGIYVLVTEKPLLNIDKTEDLTELTNLPYNQVQGLIEDLKDLEPQSWGAGFLEFEVVK